MSEDLTRYQDLILFDGPTFFFSELKGDVDAEEAKGYFHDDVRHLSLWRLLVDGEPLQGITARAVDYYAARVHLAPEPDQPPFSVRRDRFVAEGVHEDIVVTNHLDERDARRDAALADPPRRVRAVDGRRTPRAHAGTAGAARYRLA